MTDVSAQARWLSQSEMRAWRTYVNGSELLRQQLSRELQERHELALADYGVLVQLSEQDGWRTRMSHLARLVASSKSRLSHQITRLERAGLVRRFECPEDARGVYAELTDKGMALLREAAPTHVRGVRAHLIDLLTEEEQALLANLFDRVAAHLDTLQT